MPSCGSAVTPQSRPISATILPFSTRSTVAGERIFWPNATGSRRDRAERVKLPPDYWLAWGGQFEKFVAARQRLMIVVPLCFALIFLLLLSALGSVRWTPFVRQPEPLVKV
jgi:AcrB/AcrD/AcrF family protein